MKLLAIGLATAGMTFALQNLTGGALSPALGLLGLCAKVTDDDYGAQHRIWIYRPLRIAQRAGSNAEIWQVIQRFDPVDRDRLWEDTCSWVGGTVFKEIVLKHLSRKGHRPPCIMCRYGH